MTDLCLRLQQCLALQQILHQAFHHQVAAVHVCMRM